MRKVLKYAAIVLAVLVVLVVAAAAVVPSLIDWKQRVADAAEQATGRQLTIEGEVSVSLLPTVAVDAAGVRFANAPEAEQPHMAELESLSARVALWPLVTGKVVVERLALIEPTLRLSVDAEGRPNWQFDTPAEAEEDGPGDVGEAGGPGGGVPAVTLQDVRIEGGRVVYANAVTGQRVEAADIGLTAGLPAMTEAFQAELEMQLNGKPVRLSSRLATPAALLNGERAELSLDLESDPATLSYAGQVQQAPVPGLNGELSAEIPSVGDLAAWLDRPLPGRDPGRLALDASFASEGTSARLEHFELQGEAVRATASGRVDVGGETTVVELDLDSETLNVDRYLPEPQPGSGRAEPRRARQKAPGDRGNPLAALSDAPIDLTPLRQLRADIDVAIAGVRVRGIEVGALDLKATADGGTASVDLERLALYGGQVSGTVDLDARDEAAAVTGALSLNDVDLGALARAATQGPPPVAGIAGGEVEVQAEGASPRALAQSLRGRVQFDLGEVQAESAAAAKVSAVSLDAELPGVDAEPTLNARVVYDGVPVTLEARSAPLPEVVGGDRFQVTWTLQSERLSAGYEGAVQRRPVPGPDGRLELETPSVAALARWLGQPLPQGQPDPGPLSLEAQIATDGRTTRIETAKIQGQDLNASASGEVERNPGAGMRARLAIETGVLDLNRYLPAPTDAGDAAAERDGGAPSESGTADPLAALPTEPFALDGLRKLDAALDLEMAGLKLRQLTLGRTALTLRAQDGTATLELAELQGFGGTTAGTVEAQADGDALVLRADLSAESIRLEQLPGAGDLGTGVARARLQAEGRGANPRALAEAVSGSARLELADGELALGPGRLQAAQAELSLPGLNQAGSLAATATYNDRELQADLSAGPVLAALRRQAFDLSAELDAPSTALDFDGRLDPAALAGNGKLDLKVDKVGEVMTWLGLPLPEGQPDPGGLTVTAQVDGDGQRMTLESAEIGGKAVQATASGELDRAVEPMRFGLKLDVAKADLNAYLPPRGEDGGEAAGAGAGQDSQAAQDWSTEPIDTAPLRRAQGTVAVTFEQVQYRELTVDSGGLNASLEGGVLEAEITPVQLSQGTIGGNATLDGSGEAPRVRYALDVKGVQSRPVLKAFAGTDRLSGAADFTTQGQTAGPHQKALVSNLNGDGRFEFRDGAIHGINIAATLRQARSFGALAEEEAERKTDFAELSGSFDIQDGVIRNEDLKMLAPLLRLSGQGQILLPPRRLDYRTEAKLVGTLQGQGGQQALKGIPIPIKIGGTFAKPSYNIDWGSALSGAAADPQQLQQLPDNLKKNLDQQLQGSGGLGGILKGLGGGSGSGTGAGGASDGGTREDGTAQQQQQQQQQQEQQPKSDAEKAVDTIKNLFGN